MIPSRAGGRSSANMRVPQSRSGLATGQNAGFRPTTGARGIGGSKFGISVTNRPVTQQGLSGMKTANAGQGRTVADRTYFIGLLRNKTQELGEERLNIMKQIETFDKENGQYMGLSKKAEATAKEVRALQGELADYNVLQDKINTNTDIEEIEKDKQSLVVRNQREQTLIDDVFSERQEKEEWLRKINASIRTEMDLAASLVDDLGADARNKYEQLKEKNHELTVKNAELKKKHDKYVERCRQYEKEIEHDDMKKQAAALMQKRDELIKKRDALEKEDRERTLLSVPEEREKLLEKVKEDNVDISSMERKSKEIEERAAQLQDQISALDQDLEDLKGEKMQKFQELLKRDKEMQGFLDVYEKSRDEELKAHETVEDSIVELLEAISKSSKSKTMLPTKEEYDRMNMDLEHKEEEMEKAQSTSDQLEFERKRLVKDLEKVNKLEMKITNELQTHRERGLKMRRELIKYDNIDELREDSERTKHSCKKEKQNLQKRRDNIKVVVEANAKQYDVDKSKLHDNETFIQLSNMEQKLKGLMANTFSLSEFIASKTEESNYDPILGEVTALVREHNRSIINGLRERRH